jgi:UDP-2,3-diacylglucosamine pyrophosphatase LpxH
MKVVVLITFFCICLLNVSEGAFAADKPKTIFISDLHLGVGRDKDGNWDPTEDFRWSNALAAFLGKISEGKSSTTLVILGDLLELWQPLLPCASTEPDLGCTIGEMEAITRKVIEAHRGDLENLSAFSRKGSNQLYIVPGNHDAAILLKPIWKLVADAMKVTPGDRIFLVETGIWKSSDGRVVAEHGHQIGIDVNAFAKWPTITEQKEGVTYLRRPWGELFVQKLYNDRERHYPLIDNLSPESAGVRYYMGDRGPVGSIQDVARFLWFDLYETSPTQKLTSLGSGNRLGGEADWNVHAARELGYKLFAGALDKDDPFRGKLLSADSTPEWSRLRKSLDATVRDEQQVSDDQVKMLCNYLVLRGKESPDGDRCSPTLGAAIQSVAVPKDLVLKNHLNARLDAYPHMQTYIYAHTHELWFDWRLSIGAGRSVDILNTGAFQRLIDDSRFQQLARSKNVTPSEAMQRLGFEHLPACYSAVFVDDTGDDVKAQVKNWFYDDENPAALVSACDPRCSHVSGKCR